MRNYTAFITLMCLCSTQLSFGQKNYKPGLVVTNNNDTIKGEIDYRNWSVNPEQIDFRTDKNTQKFSTKDISYFEVTGLDVYVRKTVSKDMRSVSLNNPPIDNADNTVQAVAFLRILAQGKINLYELVDVKPHYYISDSTGSLRELTYRLAVNENNPSQISTQYTFRNQLNGYAIGDQNDKATSQIENADYNSATLTKIITTLNKNKSSASSTRRGFISTFFVSGGINYQTLTFDNSNTIPALVSLSPKASTAPVITAGIDISENRNRGKFFARFEVAYSTASFQANSVYTTSNGFSEKAYFNLKMSSITPALYMMYNFLKWKENSVYFGLGIAYNISSYPTNTLTTRDDTFNHTYTFDFPAQKGWMEPRLKIGTMLSKSFEVNAGIKLGGSFVGSNSVKSNPIYSLQVGYRF